MRQPVRLPISSVVALLILMVGLGGCSGSGGPAGPGPDVSGTYRGTLAFSSAQGATVSLRFTLTQASILVNGSYATGSGDFGSVSGSVVDTTFAVQARSTPLGTACDYQGGIADGVRTIAGSVKCSDGRAGSFTVSRS